MSISHPHRIVAKIKNYRQYQLPIIQSWGKEDPHKPFDDSIDSTYIKSVVDNCWTNNPNINNNGRIEDFNSSTTTPDIIIENGKLVPSAQYAYPPENSVWDIAYRNGNKIPISFNGIPPNLHIIQFRNADQCVLNVNTRNPQKGLYVKVCPI
tara:strand:+ start:303 stop:758 length:456 start_codon:yes stop_codon:yes gene_type:complete